MATTRSRGRAERAALLALLVSAALTVVKLVVWRRTGSLAVLSQTLDSALDVVAMALVYLGVRVASKPADHDHHYGHAKAENLVALAQTALLGAVAVGIVVEAVQRLRDGAAPVDVGGFALALFLGTVVVDAGRVGYLLAAARNEGSEALRAGALNFAGDIGTALVALASLVAARAGLALADPVGAVLVGVAVAVAAVGLGRRAIAVLMDRAPDPHLLQAVEAAVARVPGVAETRRVRLRGEPGSLFGDVTVAADLSASLERAHDIADSVERAVAGAAPGADVIVHVEPSQTVPAVPSGAAVAVRDVTAVHPDVVADVHGLVAGEHDVLGCDDVRVTAVGGETTVTVRVVGDGDLPLARLHAVSARIERGLRARHPAVARVTVHFAPQPLRAGRA